MSFVTSRATRRCVAYANVHEVMVSELRQRIRRTVPIPDNGQQEFENQTGINIETDIDRVVACLAPPRRRTPRCRSPAWSSRAAGSTKRQDRSADALARSAGRKLQGRAADRRRRISTPVDGRSGPLRRACRWRYRAGPGRRRQHARSCAAQSTSRRAAATTSRERRGDERVKTFECGNTPGPSGGSTRCTARRSFRPVSRARFRRSRGSRRPARIDSGVAGTFRADARDDESATSLRDMFRGIIAFARLQTNAHPEIRPCSTRCSSAGPAKLSRSPSTFLHKCSTSSPPPSKPCTARQLRRLNRTRPYAA